MSKWYKVAKRNVERGTWDEQMLSNVHEAGRITDEEYDELLAMLMGPEE